MKHYQNQRQRSLCAGLICCAFFCTLAERSPALASTAREKLLAGVKEIAAPGVPGEICVVGPKAEAVVLGGKGESMAVLVAATTIGKGRAVAFGHEGYFHAAALSTADTGRFVLNCLEWAGNERSKTQPQRGRPMRVGLVRNKGLAEFLGNHSNHNRFEAIKLAADDWAESLAKLDVLVLDVGRINTPSQGSAICQFLEGGGGLLIGSPGWGWLQLHRGRNLRDDHPGNRLLSAFGILWGEQTLKRTSKSGFLVQKVVPKYIKADVALEALVANAAGRQKLSPQEKAQAAESVIAVASLLPPTDKLLRAKLDRLKRKPTPIVPTAKKPLTKQDALARLILKLQLDELNAAAAELTRAHPAASVFPGAASSDAKTVTRSVRIETAVPGWHSTGLFAPAGLAITVSLPKNAVRKRLRLRIGAHSDRLWHLPSWRRVPEIVRSFSLDETRGEYAGAFGGLVYIEVPNACSLGDISADIAGAVESPYYVLGETDSQKWRDTIRHYPGPWAELASKKVILTVPSTAVRKLEDPEQLMTFWDKVMDACAELDTQPKVRKRPERYVADVQISAGYMHSGYPIMTHLDIVPTTVDKTALLGNKHHGVWGLFHEIGHNHQSRDWTFSGSGEVTVNLFTLYVYDTVLGYRPKSHRPNSEDSRKKLANYLAGGADFEQWKREPFLALIMYKQLQAAFGWQAFKKVFAASRDLPSGQRPKNDEQRRDQWMVSFSKTVGMNLGPFFQAWGVPTSPEARRSVESLPRWMPEGFPHK